MMIDDDDNGDVDVFTENPCPKAFCQIRGPQFSANLLCFALSNSKPCFSAPALPVNMLSAGVLAM